MSGQGLHKLAAGIQELCEPDTRDPAETQCEHGSVLTLPTDPDWELVGPTDGCQRLSTELVFVPDIWGQRVALCRFHLARFAAAFPELTERLVAKDELALDHGDPPFVTLEDVPPKIRNGNLGRVGLDQEGHAHYHGVNRDGGERVVLAVDGSLEIVRGPVYRPLETTSIDEYVRYVAGKCGWAALDERYIPEGSR